LDHEDEDLHLINNRQGGRRRGRGGGPRSPNQGPNPGNRQDNRSRGNAAQLLEKYKSLARDAQMQGDRVQSEYFLQFAEHYYRVLNENRARFEEQSRQRGDYYSDGDEDQDEAVNAAEGEEGDERDAPEEREERQFRSDRDRGDRDSRGDRDRNDRGDRNERPRRDFRAERNGEYRQERRPRDEQRDERPRREVNGAAEPEGERIALDVLPPAISVVESDSEPKTPRRRARRPRTDDGDIAPAA
jgi:hypothetical protein